MNNVFKPLDHQKPLLEAAGVCDLKWGIVMERPYEEDFVVVLTMLRIDAERSIPYFKTDPIYKLIHYDENDKVYKFVPNDAP